MYVMKLCNFIVVAFSVLLTLMNNRTGIWHVKTYVKFNCPQTFPLEQMAEKNQVSKAANLSSSVNWLFKMMYV